MCHKVIHSCIIFLAVFFFGCQKNTPPNLVIIMADDLGYGDISSYGNQRINTPNIDRMASEGIKFTDYHSNGPVCTPTRAALLTGRYQQRAGLEGVIYVRGETRQVGLDTTEVTFAELLQKNGYATGIFGKWHLGYQKEYNPVFHGFDVFRGYVSGNIDYHSHYDNASIYDWWHNTDTVTEEGYVTDLITQHALEFLENNQNGHFCMYVAHEAPHYPYQGRTDPADRYPGEEFISQGNIDPDEYPRAYKEMVEVMDEGIGKILDKLNNLGLTENTLVFFISDNGAVKIGNNEPLRGDKGSLWEGGQRVPGIAYWPGTIEPGQSGATFLSMDIMPTILSISNTVVPEGHQLDGIDMSHILFNSEANQEERDVFWRYRKHTAARSGDYKLLLTEDDTLLFNLQTDLAEQNDLAEKQPEIMSQLLNKLKAWENDIPPWDEQKTL